MIKVATVCTGIGAPEKALSNLGLSYEVVFFSEIDTSAIRSYCAINKENGNKNLGDLTKIDFAKLAKDIDLIVGGTPCQDFSASGLGKGGEEGSGTRSSLMWYYIKMIKTIRPKIVVWENVAAVLTKNHVKTYRKFYNTFTALGYKINVDLLNSKMFNLPQNRVRIFLIAVRNDVQINFKFPHGYDSGIRIKDVLKDTVPENYYTKSMDDFALYRKHNIPSHGILQLGKLNNTIFKQGNEVLSIDGIFDAIGNIYVKSNNAYVSAKKTLLSRQGRVARPFFYCLTTKRGNFILDDREPREKPIRNLMPNESLRLILALLVAFAIVFDCSAKGF